MNVHGHASEIDELVNKDSLLVDSLLSVAIRLYPVDDLQKQLKTLWSMVVVYEVGADIVVLRMKIKWIKWIKLVGCL